MSVEVSRINCKTILMTHILILSGPGDFDILHMIFLNDNPDPKMNWSFERNLRQLKLFYFVD